MGAENIHEIHLSIAENGKLLALKGEHDEALKNYREAIQLAVSSKAPEVFFRHYTQCVLESLEMTGSYDEIVEYCLKADQHFQSLELSSSLLRRDHGAVLERLGVVYVKAGNSEEGRKALTRAQALAGKGALPITDELLNWLNRGYSIDVARVLQCQKRHNYFVVRPGQVDASRAKARTPTPTHSFVDPAKALMG